MVLGLWSSGYYTCVGHLSSGAHVKNVGSSPDCAICLFVVLVAAVALFHAFLFQNYYCFIHFNFIIIKICTFVNISKLLLYNI